MSKEKITSADIEDIIIDRIERQEYLPGEIVRVKEASHRFME